jgi:hypothetical protein
MRNLNLFLKLVGVGAACAFLLWPAADAQTVACKYISDRSQVVSSTTPETAPRGVRGANPFGGGIFSDAGQLVGRGYVTYCVPATNSGGAQPTGLTIKVRCDGAPVGVPTDGGTDPARVLAINQCVSCGTTWTIAPYALSSLDGGLLTTTECVPQ